MENSEINEKTGGVKKTDEPDFSDLPEKKQEEIIAWAGRVRSRQEIEEIAKEIEANLRKLK